MRKEQFTIRVLPVVRLGLEKNLDKSSHKNLNDYINFIIESHLYKVNQEEKITDAVGEKLRELEEKLAKELIETKTELKWNKTLLAKVLGKLGVE